MNRPSNDSGRAVGDDRHLASRTNDRRALAEPHAAGCVLYHIDLLLRAARMIRPPITFSSGEPAIVTIDDLAAMRAPSRPRNPTLTQFLREIPGYMERIGSGARLMIQEMRQLGLADPEFAEQHEFLVTFRNGQLPTTADAAPFNARQLLALRIVQDKGSISSQEYIDATGLAERTALRELRAMVDRGIFAVRGKARNTRYHRAF